MEPEYLRSCSKGMLDSIKDVDKDGVWLIESWTFSNSEWEEQDILLHRMITLVFLHLYRLKPS